MLINIHDSWNATAVTGHKAYVDSIVANANPAAGTLLHDLLVAYGSVLANGKPDVLRTVIKFVATKRKKISQAKFNKFKSECKSLFNYAKFSNKNTPGWNAYSLCSNSTCVVCPYCQQAVASTIEPIPGRKNSFRPTLDHFYTKSEYPYLALSLYNLVPSCYVCNSSLKGSKNFFTSGHLHPFEDDECIRYVWDVVAHIQARKLGLKTFPVKVSYQALTTGKVNAARRSAKTFLLEERLDASKHFVQSFMELALRNKQWRIDEMNAGPFKNIGYDLTVEQALQFSSIDYKNEWLGRLKADLLDAANAHWRAP